MKIAVTGSTSLIGARLIQKLEIDGYQVIPLGGKSSNLWRLGEEFPNNVDADVLVHLAHNRSFTLEQNVKSAEVLCKSFQGVKIFLSSLSAHSNSKSKYGKSKLAIERVFSDSGGVALRAGIVYGGEASGILEKVEGLVRRFPVSPVPYSGLPLLFTTHLDDLLDEIVSLFTAELRVVVFAAHEKPTTLLELSRKIARKHNLERLFVPLPCQPLDYFLRLLPRLLPNFSLADSLLSLSSQPSPRELSQLKVPKTAFRNFDGFT